MSDVRIGGIVVTGAVLAEARYEVAHEAEERYPAWAEASAPQKARARDDADGYARALVWIAEHPERFGGAR